MKNTSSIDSTLEINRLDGPQSMEEDDGLDYTISHKPTP